MLYGLTNREGNQSGKNPTTASSAAEGAKEVALLSARPLQQQQQYGQQGEQFLQQLAETKTLFHLSMNSPLSFLFSILIYQCQYIFFPLYLYIIMYINSRVNSYHCSAGITRYSRASNIKFLLNRDVISSDYESTYDILVGCC